MWPEANLGLGRATGTHGYQRPKVVEGSKQTWVDGQKASGAERGGSVDGV